MNSILVQVPEWGTGRRAKLEGIKTAGKTGTTSAYRDAWFVGFTGNYVAAVWMGNDSYQPTRRLTGGSLPATIWNRVMTFAHTGIKLKPIPYIEDALPADAGAAVADATAGDGEADVGSTPAALSAATTARLIQLEEMMRSAPELKPIAELGPRKPPDRIGLAGADPSQVNLTTSPQAR